MLGTAINLNTARILNLARSSDSAKFNEYKILLLADNLSDRVMRLGDSQLYSKFSKRINNIKTREDYTKVCNDILELMKTKKFNQEKIACVEGFTKRMADIDQTTCKRFYDILVSDYDIATIDREAKMWTTIKAFDENGKMPPLFKQDKDGKFQTYTDKDGRERYKINTDMLDFDNFNRLSKFLRDNGLKIHVNALIWPNEEPTQIKKLAESDLSPSEKKRQCEDFLYGYINEFAKNAREQGIHLDSVEVLNEIVNDDPKSDEVMRDCAWKTLLGEDYYIDCYKVAKKAFDQDTKLFYNDFSEFDPKKKGKIIQMVKKVQDVEKEEGISLLDGIGLQCHFYGDDFDYDAGIKEYLKVAKSGTHQKEVRITEIDSADCHDHSWQQEQMQRCIDAAMDNGLETIGCWSDLSPFADHLENVSNIGLLTQDGKTTDLHEDIKEHFSDKSKDMSEEKSLSKPSTDGSGSDDE